MRMLLVSCLMAAVWAATAVPSRAEVGSTALTVVIRAGQETKYEEVVQVLRALADAKVARIEAEVDEQQKAGVSAVLRARCDASYKAVVTILETLHAAGVRKLMIATKP
jgi:biopolymer transport protein ExbD